MQLLRYPNLFGREVSFTHVSVVFSRLRSITFRTEQNILIGNANLPTRFLGLWVDQVVRVVQGSQGHDQDPVV